MDLYFVSHNEDFNLCSKLIMVDKSIIKIIEDLIYWDVDNFNIKTLFNFYKQNKGNRNV